MGGGGWAAIVAATDASTMAWLSTGGCVGCGGAWVGAGSWVATGAQAASTMATKINTLKLTFFITFTFFGSVFAICLRFNFNFFWHCGDYFGLFSQFFDLSQVLFHQLGHNELTLEILGGHALFHL